MHEIQILDSVQCKAVGKELINAIAPCLTYKRKHVRQGQFAKEVKVDNAYAIDRRNGLFYSGLLPRVCTHLDNQKVQWELTHVNDNGLKVLPSVKPGLKGYTLRPEQLMLINKATAGQRGVIKAPTGTGKTIIALGLISQYTYHHALILVHRLDLLNQFYERMVQAGFGPKDICLVSGSSKPPVKDLLTKPYTVAMVQSYGKYPIKKLCIGYEVIIGDEIHHCIEANSKYGKIMRTHLAPVKIGFTATVPTDHKDALMLEGLVGPVIGELSIAEAVGMGSMAEPHVTLINVPYNTNVGEHRKWKDLYKHGIVNNRVRNGLLLKAVKERLAKGLTCLIMVKELAHGNNLSKLAQLMGFDAVFIHGKHASGERNRVREALNNRELNCVITTDIWREGVDIPTLNVVVNAAGGKSEIQTLQVIGRGARRAEGKDTVEIIDFVDVYRYLAEHFARRMQLYNQHKWI